MNQDFIIDHNKEITTDKDTSYYCMIGHHDFIDGDKNPRSNKDNNNACAKKIITTNSTKFYVKIGLYGKIYNHIGMFSEGTGAKFLAKTGKKAWDYKQVNSKVFDMYICFLKTKNQAWLNNAERELN